MRHVAFEEQNKQEKILVCGHLLVLEEEMEDFAKLAKGKESFQHLLYLISWSASPKCVLELL